MVGANNISDDHLPQSRPSRVAVVAENPTQLLNLIAVPFQGPSVHINWLLSLESGLRPIHDRSTLTESLAHHDQAAHPERWNSTLQFIRDHSHVDAILKLAPGADWTNDQWRNVLSTVADRTFASQPGRFEVEYAQREANGERSNEGLATVIIPTFGRSSTLVNAIDSVLSQTYSNLELLVVDDNPADSSARREVTQVLQPYLSDSRLRYLQHDRNRNGSAARNTGIFQAQGEFVSFLDDDDVYLPNMLRDCIDKLRQSPADIGAVYGGYLGWNSTENDLARYKAGDLTLDILKLRYADHYLCTNTVVYRRSSLVSINGYDESFRRHQDLEINLRFFQRYHIDVVRELVVQIRPHETGTTNEPDGPGIFRLKQKFLERFRSIIETFPENERLAIYDAHWKDARRVFGSRMAFAEYVRSQAPNQPCTLWAEDCQELERIRERLNQLNEQLNDARQTIQELRAKLQTANSDLREVRQESSAREVHFKKLILFSKLDVTAESLAQLSDKPDAINELIKPLHRPLVDLLLAVRHSIRNTDWQSANELIAPWKEAMKIRYRLAIALALGQPNESPQTIALASPDDLRPMIQVSAFLRSEWLRLPSKQSAPLGVRLSPKGTLRVGMPASDYEEPVAAKSNWLWSLGSREKQHSSRAFQATVTAQGRVVGLFFKAHAEHPLKLKLTLQFPSAASPVSVELAELSTADREQWIDIPSTAELGQSFVILVEANEAVKDSNLQWRVTSFWIEPKWNSGQSKAE